MKIFNLAIVYGNKLKKNYDFQQERLDIEEKYSNLQEEKAGKTKKLKKVWTMLMQAKSEVCKLYFLFGFLSS